MNNYLLLQTVANNGLNTLTHLLEKAEIFCKENGIAQNELLGARIYEDMFPFVRQVQIATDDARRGLLLLAGKEHVSFQDDETTIAALKDRIARSKEIVASLKHDDFLEADERHISLYWMGGKYMLGKEFVQELALSNFLFHVVTAYNILRMKGVSIGKMDFLPRLSLHTEETK